MLRREDNRELVERASEAELAHKGASGGLALQGETHGSLHKHILLWFELYPSGDASFEVKEVCGISRLSPSP